MLSRLPRVADALSSCYYEQATVSECILIPSVTLTCIIRTRLSPRPYRATLPPTTRPTLVAASVVSLQIPRGVHAMSQLEQDSASGKRQPS